MAQLRLKRNIQHSTYDFITAKFDAQWTGINVVLTWEDAMQAEKPVVCILLESTESKGKELGSNNLFETHLIILDIYAKSRGQAMDLADYIKNEIKNGYVYNLYSHPPGSFESLDATPDGRVKTLKFLRDESIDFGDNTDERDKWRHTIAYTVRVT